MDTQLLNLEPSQLSSTPTLDLIPLFTLLKLFTLTLMKESIENSLSLQSLSTSSSKMAQDTLTSSFLNTQRNSISQLLLFFSISLSKIQPNTNIGISFHVIKSALFVPLKTLQTLMRNTPHPQLGTPLSQPLSQKVKVSQEEKCSRDIASNLVLKNGGIKIERCVPSSRFQSLILKENREESRQMSLN